MLTGKSLEKRIYFSFFLATNIYKQRKIQLLLESIFRLGCKCAKTKALLQQYYVHSILAGNKVY